MLKTFVGLPWNGLGRRSPSFPFIHSSAWIYKAKDFWCSLRNPNRLHSEDKLKLNLVQSLEENPDGEVSLLQSLLLINVFGRMFAKAVHHATSQLFHSPSVLLANHLGVLSQEPDDERYYADTVDGWLQWSEDEERIRVGWLVFLLDCSNAALFR